MRRVITAVGAVLLITLAAACGGRSTPAVPTLVPLVATSPPESQPQQAAARAEDAQPDVALNRPAQLPEQLLSEEAPPPPWPTFTPGPGLPPGDHLVLARSHRFYTARADGGELEQLKFNTDTPPLLAASYKEPGRGWLSPDGRTLLYFAGDEAQLWWGDVQTHDNGLLAERLLPPEAETELIHALTTQEMAWTSSGNRAALLGAPNQVELFVVDVPSHTATQITDDDHEESGMVWSTDELQLAYLSVTPGSETEDVFIWDATTQKPTRIDLQPMRDAAGVGENDRLSFRWQMEWLGDSRLALYPHIGSEPNSLGIWVYDVAAQQLTQIVADGLDDVDWSPAAQAWTYTRADEPGTIWVVGLSGGEPRAVAKGDAHAPVWSPDGSEVLYSVSDPDVAGWNLGIADVNGNSRIVAQNVSLIENDLSQLGPRGKRYWGPDGSFVLYTSVGRDYGRAEAQEGYGGQAGPDLENWWLAPVNGGTPRMASDLQKVFYLQEPELSPDGEVWAFLGFSYTDRLQHLYTMPVRGGHPQPVDAGVGWFGWLR